MIHLYNAINQYYQKQFDFLSFFHLILLDILAKEIQKDSNNFIYFITHHNFYFITLCMHGTSFIRIIRGYKINYNC